ncbi:unnamed protein product [Clonostachys rosea]|uniref:RRM domain-containing protein n=1 Tax=Bionectria ochroleuca TaxID=29856 RepID=A0ABY6TVD7_BIOOC|nr:unnamed protein product [Clonostachys rosea]
MASSEERSVSPEANGAETKPKSSSKRKNETDEIEIDLAAPEPPSKRAKRALKKGKSASTKKAGKDDDRDLLDGEDEKEADGKPKRSEHSVWIGNLPFSVTATMLKNWLVSNSGGVITDDSITRIKIPTTKTNGRDKTAKPVNKGFAFVDFSEIGPKVSAIALSENDLAGRKLLIKDAKSFEGRPKKEPEPAAAGEQSKDGSLQQKDAFKQHENASRKVFVGNMSFKATEEDLYRNFEKCGEIEFVKLATFEDTGKCKGFGWVKFKEPEAAAWAVKGFVKIKEKVETEADFKDEEDGDDEKPQEKQFKTRKWWVNRMFGRELKLELAEDDHVRYKKRFGKDARKDDGNEGRGKGRPPRSRGQDASDGPTESKELRTADDIQVAKLTGAVVKSTGTKVTFDYKKDRHLTTKMYEAVIVFTLDTICPWTFLAKKRLDEALAKVRASQVSPDVTFTVRYDSFQLHPDLPETVDKQEWYLRNMHMDNPDAQKLYQAHMSDQFKPLGITLCFDGTIGNTFQAHRVIQYFQEEKGPETASRLVDGLFMRYLTEAKHPTSEETLVESCVKAGIDREEATAVVRDQSKKEGEVKRGMQDVARDIDSVPSIRFEGRRRDITIRGAKEVPDYIKTLETIIKDSS